MSPRLTSLTAVALAAFLMSGCGVLDPAEPEGDDSGLTSTERTRAAARGPVGGGDGGTAAGSWADTIEQLQPGVLRIAVATCEGAGTGSGFLVDETLVVSNAHVVRGAAQVAVGQQGLPAEIIGLSEEADLALLQLPEPLEERYVLSWAEEPPRVGDDVAALGYPSGAFSSTRGGISSLNPSEDYLSADVQYIQTDAAVNPGNSGGPLVTLDGDVAGVVFAKATTTPSGVPLEGTGFAVHVDDARQMVENWTQNPQPVPLEECSIDADTPEPVNDDEVEIVVESDHEFAEAVAQTFALHGNAINTALYPVAFSLFTPPMQDRMGGLTTWQEGLHTSFWRAMLIGEVAGSADQLTARALLATEQAPEYGPDGQACSVFAIEYTLIFDDDRGVWLIDRAESLQDPEPCPE